MLTIDILAYITSFLDAVSVCNFRRVSKLWKSIAGENVKRLIYEPLEVSTQSLDVHSDVDPVSLEVSTEGSDVKPVSLEVFTKKEIKIDLCALEMIRKAFPKLTSLVNIIVIDSRDYLANVPDPSIHHSLDNLTHFILEGSTSSYAMKFNDLRIFTKEGYPGGKGAKVNSGRLSLIGRRSYINPLVKYIGRNELYLRGKDYDISIRSPEKSHVIKIHEDSRHEDMSLVYMRVTPTLLEISGHTSSCENFRGLMTENIREIRCSDVDGLGALRQRYVSNTSKNICGDVTKEASNSYVIQPDIPLTSRFPKLERLILSFRDPITLSILEKKVFPSISDREVELHVEMPKIIAPLGYKDFKPFVGIIDGVCIRVTKNVYFLYPTLPEIPIRQMLRC